jgi:hypothetical protein
MKPADLTVWWCETCHASGRVAISRCTVQEGVEAIKNAHARHELAAGCAFDPDEVRVRVEWASAARVLERAVNGQR